MKHAPEPLSRRISRPTRDGSPLTAGPGYRMRTALAALRAELARQLAEHGISETHYYYLRSLLERDGQTLAELSASVGVKPATATGVIDTMAALGLVERVPHATDRRKMHVYLTAAGRALRQPLLRSLQTLNAIALDGLSEEQWSAFCGVCELIVQNLTAAGPRPSSVEP